MGLLAELQRHLQGDATSCLCLSWVSSAVNAFRQYSDRLLKKIKDEGLTLLYQAVRKHALTAERQ